MGETSARSFRLKILVAKNENKVIFAESGKEFIEVLFSFMTLPIASAVRHTRSLPGDIGCLNNLYGSVENLDMTYFQEERFRNILLNPRSAADIYCKNLELDLTENGCNEFYACRSKDCEVISYYNVGQCRCGKFLTLKQSSSSFPLEKDVFLKSTAPFVITDDFKLMPVAAMGGLAQLNELGKYEKIEERTIIIGSDEVLKLLKCSLRSRTPLSETFLQPIDKSSHELPDMKYGPGGMNLPQKVKNFQKGRTNIRLKLIFDKVDNTVLYAAVKEDFINLLCTFLTFPLGYIFHQLPCFSFEGCMGNLHKSIQDADVNLFRSEKRKEMLVNPKLAPGLAYDSNLIGIKEATISSECSAFESLLSGKNYGCSAFESHLYPKITGGRRNINTALRQNPDQGREKVFEGFIEGPAMFMVMDNLEVKPLSPISTKFLVDKSMVPLSDIGEQEVILDEDKALRLLAASLATRHALTSTFLQKETNIDCLDFLGLMWENFSLDFLGLTRRGKGIDFKATK